jgi:hypothetical protein
MSAGVQGSVMKLAGNFMPVAGHGRQKQLNQSSPEN